MKRFTKEPDPAAQEWRNLRDEEGRLYGRVNRTLMLLELRRNQKTVTFDLRVLISIQEKRDIVDNK
jgi:hypothetical protein